MPAVNGHQSLPGEEAKPNERSHGRIDEVLIQLPFGVEKGLLQHVGWVHAPGHTPIQTELNHPPQAVPVPHEHFRECRPPPRANRSSCESPNLRKFPDPPMGCDCISISY